MPLPLLDSWRSIRSQLFPRLILAALGDRDIVIREWSSRRLAKGSACWRLPVPDGLLVGGVPREPGLLGDFLGDFLLEQGIVNGRALVALPPQCAQWRVLPAAAWGSSSREWRAALQPLEAALHLPFGLGEADLVLSSWPGAGHEAMLLATHRPVMDAWIDVFSIAGVSLERLLPAQVCWMDGLMNRLVDGPSTQISLLLHWSESAMWLVAWYGTEPLYQACCPAVFEQCCSTLLNVLAFLRARFEVSSIAVWWDGPADGLQWPWPARVALQPLHQAAESTTLALDGLTVAVAGPSR